MSNLSTPFKFLGARRPLEGYYRSYGLHWSESSNRLANIAEMIYTDRFSEMLAEIKRGLEIVPREYSNYVRFDVLTGLRHAEATQSRNMLRAWPLFFIEPGLLPNWVVGVSPKKEFCLTAREGVGSYD